MIAFMIIIYVAIIVILFKVLHLKPKPYRIAWIVVAGILALVGIVVGWMQSAPLSEKLVTTQYVVQLVPYVKGQVKAVYAQANQPLKKGDLLLEIDPAPYQYTVDQLEAQLKQAKQLLTRPRRQLKMRRRTSQRRRRPMSWRRRRRGLPLTLKKRTGPRSVSLKSPRHNNSVSRQTPL